MRTNVDKREYYAVFDNLRSIFLKVLYFKVEDLRLRSVALRSKYRNSRKISTLKKSKRYSKRLLDKETYRRIPFNYALYYALFILPLVL